MVMELEGKKILVVGLGKTGVETARFLSARKSLVKASDKSPFEALSDEAKGLREYGVELETGGHTEEAFLWAEVVVLSPGVPFNVPLIQDAVNRGIDVISEVELASNFINTPVIAVTGSNGKTTTSTLIAGILKRGGKHVFLGANIGTPLISIADTSEQYDVLVLELSSFQLQGIKTFRPDISVVLNISPNHLDHHKDFDEYIRSKMKIVSNQTGSDYFIFNGEDGIIREYALTTAARKMPFGYDKGTGRIYYDRERIHYDNEIYELKGTKLIGDHNIENIMAAIAGTRILGCEQEVIQKEIIEFTPLPHRNEYLGERMGAKFYNDSKSTSPAATVRALESHPSPIILIAGGKDKGVSFSNLKDIVSDKVKFMVLFGESKLRMQKELGAGVHTELADSIEDAMDKTLQKVAPRDTVLFSPACSSFDMFDSYEQRGRRYKDIVKNL